jgi:hypothetical protein
MTWFGGDDIEDHGDVGTVLRFYWIRLGVRSGMMTMTIRATGNPTDHALSFDFPVTTHHRQILRESPHVRLLVFASTLVTMSSFRIHREHSGRIVPLRPGKVWQSSLEDAQHQ